MIDSFMLTIFHRLIHWFQGSKSGWVRFRGDRENLLKTREIIYFQIRDWFWAVGSLGRPGGAGGAARTGGFGCGGLQFLQ